MPVYTLRFSTLNFSDFVLPKGTNLILKTAGDSLASPSECRAKILKHSERIKPSDQTLFI